MAGHRAAILFNRNSFGCHSRDCYHLLANSDSSWRTTCLDRCHVNRLFCHCLDYAGCTLRRTMAVMDYCKYRIRHYVDSPDWKRFFCSYHGCNVDCLLIQLHIWILQLEKTCCEKQQTSLTPLVFRIFTNFPSPKILQLPKSSRSIFQSNSL